MWEGLDPELKALVVKCGLAALGFASMLGALVARKVYTYVEIIADAKIEEARGTSTRRLALAGEMAAASTEEAARGTDIKGPEKAEIAAGAVSKLLELPAKIDGLTAEDPAVRAAVRAGVAKLRASVPAPSTYVFTQSQIPAPIDVVVSGGAKPFPPAPRLPSLEDRPTSPARPAPKQGG